MAVVMVELMAAAWVRTAMCHNEWVVVNIAPH